MESKNLKDVYNRLIDLYGFYEINKDSDEYKIALRFMSQEDLLKDDIDNIRLLVKDDGEDYMYFIINENTDYIGGGACGEEMVISTPDSKVTIIVVPTDEEYMIAADTMDILGK